jgi:hypothetical protein
MAVACASPRRLRASPVGHQALRRFFKRTAAMTSEKARTCGRYAYASASLLPPNASEAEKEQRRPETQGRYGAGQGGCKRSHLSGVVAQAVITSWSPVDKLMACEPHRVRKPPGQYCALVLCEERTTSNAKPPCLTDLPTSTPSAINQRFSRPWCPGVAGDDPRCGCAPPCHPQSAHQLKKRAPRGGLSAPG